MATAGGRQKADLKVVILGVSNIGKTALISRYIDGKFSSPSEQTIGASFSLKQWGPYNVAIWDTAGGERFMGLSSFYCRNAGAAILAYDLRDQESFDALSARFVPLLQSAEENCLCVVVGTKSDLLTSADNPHAHNSGNDVRENKNSKNEAQTFTDISNSTSRVPVEHGLQLAKELNKSRHFENTEVPYFETSSLANQNVDAVFEYIFQCVLPLDKADEIRAKRSGSMLNLEQKKSGTSPNSEKPQKKCC